MLSKARQREKMKDEEHNRMSVRTVDMFQNLKRLQLPPQENGGSWQRSLLRKWKIQKAVRKRQHDGDQQVKLKLLRG